MRECKKDNQLVVELENECLIVITEVKGGVNISCQKGKPKLDYPELHVIPMYHGELFITAVQEEDEE